jgi:UDP-glucose 6-dehydrogenase
MLHKNLKEGRIHFTTDTEHAVRQSLTIFIAVGTPVRKTALRISAAWRKLPAHS